MGPLRYLMHWWIGLRGAATAFPLSVRESIEREIAAAERLHQGEICFAVQAALGFPPLWRGVTSQQCAMRAFASLGVWDTAENNGVLIYVLLADRAVEIIADRGIAALIPSGEWQSLCNQVQERFRVGDFEAGAVMAVRGVAERLARHFPAIGLHENELPNQPILL
jgi:uncharacterized membrane protein YgcG